MKITTWNVAGLRALIRKNGWDWINEHDPDVLCLQEIKVVDTLPPEIFCNAPETMTPPNAPISFISTSTDNCEDSPAVGITDFDCYKYTKKGKRIDKTESCVIEIDGNDINILDSGGVVDNIIWTVQAIDDSGNDSEITCEVEVVRP